MLYHILALGDVAGESGVRHLRKNLSAFKRLKDIAFTVVNGENVSGVGLTPEQAEDLFAAGADVITLGNHTWGRMQIADYLEDNPYILRPANFSARTPGRGWAVYDCGRATVGVMNLIGRCDLDWRAADPFATADRLLRGEDRPTFTLVDFHAEATSEKLALAYYLDGVRPEQSVESFLGGLPGRFRPAEGPCKAQGCVFTLDDATGLCTAVERVDIR